MGAAALRSMVNPDMRSCAPR